MKMLRIALTAALLAVALPVAEFALSAGEVSKNPAGKMLRDASLMLLKEGNDRFAAGKSQHPNLDLERRNTTGTSGQEPFATVLACADSRVAVELLFDRGIGDLFITRVAGNIAGESELATLEYGVGHLNTPVLIVLGHTKCGAVTAVTKGAELEGHLHSLAAFIEPAAKKARVEATGPDDLVPRAIQANVWNTLERILRESAVIREKTEAGTVHLVGALYDLETGRVTWLGGHPAQGAIIALANQATTDAALAQSKESFAPSPAKNATNTARPTTTRLSSPTATGSPSSTAAAKPTPATTPGTSKTTATAPPHGTPPTAKPSRTLVGGPTESAPEPGHGHSAPDHH